MDKKKCYNEYVEIILEPVREELEPEEKLVPLSRITHDKHMSCVINTVSNKPTFRQTAKKYENKIIEYAEEVPFFSYWPTYHMLDYKQKQWYFFWRGKVRQGEYIDTDESYLYLHVYEILYGIGWDDAEDGALYLYKLIKAYENKGNKIYQDFLVWLFDFCTLHKISMQNKIFITEFQNAESEQLFSFWLDNSKMNNFDDIKGKTIFRLAKATMNKKILDDSQLCNAFVKSFINLNALLKRKTGKDILDSFGPYEEICDKRFAYPNALKDKLQKIDIIYHVYLSQEKVVQFCKDFIKTFLVCITKKTYERKISILSQQKEPYEIKEFVCAKTLHEVLYPLTKFSIDSGKLQLIRDDSELTMARLTINDENIEAENDEFREMHFSSNAFKQNVTHSNKDTFFTSLSDIQYQILKIIYCKDSDCNRELEKIALQEGELKEVLLDKINSLFFTFYDDYLIDLCKRPPEIYEEYRGIIKKECIFNSSLEQIFNEEDDMYEPKNNTN